MELSINLTFETCHLFAQELVKNDTKLAEALLNELEAQLYSVEYIEAIHKEMEDKHNVDIRVG